MKNKILPWNYTVNSAIQVLKNLYHHQIMSMLRRMNQCQWSVMFVIIVKYFKYNKTKPRTMTSCPLAKRSNKTVHLNLKELALNTCFLHMIHHLTRFSTPSVNNSTHKEVTLKKIVPIWISIFNSAMKFPRSNFTVERHNFILGYTVAKTNDDVKYDSELALPWTTSAKNYI